MKTTDTIKIEVPNLTGKQWIKRLEKAEYKVSNYAKVLLLSDDFKAMPGNYEVVIVKVKEVGQYPTTAQIREYAATRGYIIPPTSLAPALRESISDEEIKGMDLWYFITMHEPIKDSDGDPDLLGSDRGGDGRELNAIYGRPGDGWSDDGGFAFVVPQVGAKASPAKPSLDPSNLESRITALEAWQKKVIEALRTH